VKIHFERSGGIAGLRLHADVDSADLQPDEARELDELVGHSGLATPTPPRHPAIRVADGFSYSFAIDDGVQRNAFACEETALPPSARPLVDWLTRRALR
jgi:hypothetical protein